MQTVLVIDNYDSFTYNLVQYLGELGADIRVFRNDQVTIEQVQCFRPEKIVISPGPGDPASAGISVEVIRKFSGAIPLLGVCLGHQAIAQAFGGKVVRADQLMHGKTSMIYHQQDSILSGLPSPFEATRYHSLLVSRDSFPDCLLINAWTVDGTIMGVRHISKPVFGVQFHPESILTRVGKRILENFLCWPNFLKS